MISSFDAVWTLGATRIAVPVGATVAIFCQPVAGQVSWLLKYLSGGTCEILPTGIGQTLSPDFNYGTTSPLSTLVSQSGNGYLLGPIGITGTSWESLSIPGPASFYLSSTGATSIIAALMMKSQGK